MSIWISLIAYRQYYKKRINYLKEQRKAEYIEGAIAELNRLNDFIETRRKKKEAKK